LRLRQHIHFENVKLGGSAAAELGLEAVFTGRCKKRDDAQLLEQATIALPSAGGGFDRRKWRASCSDASSEKSKCKG
jgi:hypothetical protein